MRFIQAVVAAATFLFAIPAAAQEASSSQGIGNTIKDALIGKGAFSADELVIVKAGSALKPGILDGAARKALADKDAATFLSEITGPEINAYRTDLIARAKLTTV